MVGFFSYHVVNTTRLPSGVHSGATTLPSEVSFVNVRVVASRVQISELVVSPRIVMTLTATRRPSGEKRGPPLHGERWSRSSDKTVITRLPATSTETRCCVGRPRV